MPNVVFFTAHNGIQLEIGYVNVSEIIGDQVEFKINHKENYISYKKIPILE